MLNICRYTMEVEGMRALCCEESMALTRLHCGQAYGTCFLKKEMYKDKKQTLERCSKRVACKRYSYGMSRTSRMHKTYRHNRLTG
jgi:hypothetical protein